MKKSGLGSSQQHRLERMKAKRAAGKDVKVKVGSDVYLFGSVVWGGTSPLVCLIKPDNTSECKSAAEWKKLGAKL